MSNFSFESLSINHSFSRILTFIDIFRFAVRKILNRSYWFVWERIELWGKFNLSNEIVYMKLNKNVNFVTICGFLWIKARKSFFESRPSGSPLVCRSQKLQFGDEIIPHRRHNFRLFTKASRSRSSEQSKREERLKCYGNQQSSLADIAVQLKSENEIGENFVMKTEGKRGK